MIRTLDMPLKPIFIKKWGQVTVKDVLDNVFALLWDKALRKACKVGECTIVFPEKWEHCSNAMFSYLKTQLQRLRLNSMVEAPQYNCKVQIDTFSHSGKYIEVCETAFHLNDARKNIVDIPTHWDDNEKEWTWNDVCNNRHFYSSSSSSNGQPWKLYKQKAQMETVRTKQQNVYSKYFSYANRK